MAPSARPSLRRLSAAFLLALSLVAPVLRSDDAPEQPPAGGDPPFPSANPDFLAPEGSGDVPGARQRPREGGPVEKRERNRGLRFDLRSRKETALERAHIEVSGEVQPPVPGSEGRCAPGMIPGAAAGGGGIVFGGDGRTEISPTTSYPYRAIGKIYAWFHDASNDPSNSVAFADCVGTGALVGPCHVLTAGHVIYNHDPTCGWIGWADKIVFVPALYTDSSGTTIWPYGSQNGTNVMSYEAWTQDEDEDHDWGMIVLDQAIGDTVGWFGYSTADSDGSTRNISGYPADRNSGLDQFWMAGEIDCENTYNLKYEIDTAGGQSGAPIWRYDGVSRYIHGVHTTGGVPLACGFVTKNRGVRITSGKFDSIQDWKSQYTCPADADEADGTDDGDDRIDFGDLVPKPFGPIRVYMTIRNAGVRPIQSIHVAGFLSRDKVRSPDDTLIDVVAVGPLTCFEPAVICFDRRLPIDIEPGKYHFGWVIDPENEVREFNEDNNAGFSSETITVRPRSRLFRRGEVNQDSRFRTGEFRNHRTPL